MNYRFQVTRDVELLREISLSPNNIKWMGDDEFQDRDKWLPDVNNPVFTFLLVSDESNQIMGFFTLIDLGTGLEAHLSFLPKAYGQVVAIGKQAASFLFQRLPHDFIIAPVVSDNRLACKCIVDIGFKLHDVLESVWKHDGRWLDMNMYILNKHDIIEDNNNLIQGATT